MYVTYGGGIIGDLDQNFVKAMNKLIELHDRGVEVKILVHPKVCKDLGPNPPSFVVASKLIKMLNEMNKTLGYEHLRVAEDTGALGLLTSWEPEASLLIDGSKMVVIDDRISTGIVVIKLTGELAKYAKEWFEGVFNGAKAWNPDKVC